MNKKIIISAGALITSVAPIISVIACSPDEPTKTIGSTGTQEDQSQKIEELVLDGSILQTPKELIDKIFEKTNMQYSKNFLDVLKVDDDDDPTKLTDESKKTFLDYYSKIKPVKVKFTFNGEEVQSTLDLTKEIQVIKDEIKNDRYTDDYSASASKVSGDAVAYIKDSTKASPNISAYIGTMSNGLGMAMLPMRVISDKAWNAYMEELDKIHTFIWTIASSSSFKGWNKDKDYELIKTDGSQDIKKSGSYFDGQNVQFTMPQPKFPNESSNLEAAFAVSLLNLFTPLEGDDS